MRASKQNMQWSFRAMLPSLISLERSCAVATEYTMQLDQRLDGWELVIA